MSWNRYDFEGPTRFDKLFTGIAVERPAWLVPGDTTGCEGIGPEDSTARSQDRYRGSP